MSRWSVQYDAAVKRFVVQPHEIVGGDAMAGDRTDWKIVAMTWLTGQPYENVLLSAILCGGAYLAHYVVTVAMPAQIQHERDELRQIQEGYERIEESHKADRALIIQQYDKWFESIRNDGDATGAVSPGPAIQNVWESFSERPARETDYAHGKSIGFEDEDNQRHVESVEADHQSVERLEFRTAGGNQFTLVRSSRATEPGGHLPWSDLRRDRFSFGANGPVFDATGQAIHGSGDLPGVSELQTWWRNSGNRF